MRRSGRNLAVAACLLCANLKVRGLAAYPGALESLIGEALRRGYGLIPLPCPETTYLGMSRWGMTKEQYDTAAYRRHCRTILEPTLDAMEALLRDGQRIDAVIGVDGSPSCGVSRTCFGYLGGELAGATDLAALTGNLREGPGRGVLMEELMRALGERGLDLPFVGVDEARPEGTDLEELLTRTAVAGTPENS
jgi:predicted secreted protein